MRVAPIPIYITAQNFVTVEYKYCVYVRCRDDSLIHDYYLAHERKPLPHALLDFGHHLKKLCVAQNSAVLLHCSYVSGTGNKQLPGSHIF